MINIIRKKHFLFLLIFSFISAAIFLAICSKCSFLYKINNWSDVNIYYTIGKSITKGKILYKDIMDQKGPLIFFLFTVAYKISNTSLLGVYLLEIISMGLFAFISARFASLYIKDTKKIYCLIPVVIALITSARAFGMGGSAEELCLVFLGYSLYSVLGSIKRKRDLKTYEVILNGVCAGAIFWIKYTILGLHVGLVLFIVFMYIKQKKIKKLPTLILKFLLGVVIVTIPVLMYFILTDSLKDLWMGYGYINIFMYPGTMSIADRIIWTVRAIWFVFKVNPQYSILIVIGILWMVLKRNMQSVCVVLSFMCMAFVMYMGGRIFDYYGIIFSVFSTLGIVWIVSLVDKRIKVGKVRCAVIILCEFVMLIAFTYYFSGNTELMKYQENQFPQYTFAKEICKLKDAKIINYDNMDRGFYLLTDSVPDCKYYFTMNMKYDEMTMAQDRYIEEKKADFIITRNKKLEEYKIDSSGYQLIKSQDFYEEDYNQKYYLYKNSNLE